MRFLLALALSAAPITGFAGSTQKIVEEQILPGYLALQETSAALRDRAANDCTPNQKLRDAYGAAFDAWTQVSHLRFGPSETEDRAFALAFWPDSRGATPKTLSALIAQEDPVVETAESYADVSVAARGFYALEFLLYDPSLANAVATDYGCQLLQTISADIAMTSDAILQDWQSGYAEKLLIPSADGPYRTDAEATQALFKALSTGLQFTSEARLGRPLGTFDKPRPMRAEARRSERSLRHVVLSLEALQDMALSLSQDAPEIQDKLTQRFAKALEVAARVDDPAFASVADPGARIKVEALQSAVEAIRLSVALDLAPHLGVSAGFNALDGD